MKWLLLLLSVPAWANITYDSNVVACTQASGSSCTGSITTSSTATMMVVVEWGYTANDAVSTVTFNTFGSGWALQKNGWDGSHNGHVEIWTKASPTTSLAANVVVTLNSSSTNWGFFAYTLSGTKTATFTDGTACGAATAGALNGSLACGSITTANDGSWVIDAFVTSPNTVTVTPPGTQITTGTISTNLGVAGYKEIHPAGAYNPTYSWTGTTTAFSDVAAVGIQAASYTPPGNGTNGVQISVGLP